MHDIPVYNTALRCHILLNLQTAHSINPQVRNVHRFKCFGYYFKMMLYLYVNERAILLVPHSAIVQAYVYGRIGGFPTQSNL